MFSEISLNYISKKWFYLAIISLVMAGILSISVGFLRLPVFANVANLQNIFDKTLVVHVNASILIWNLSIAMIFITSQIPIRGEYTILSNIAFISLIMMIISILVPNSEVIKSNYIPIIDNFIFFFSLSLFGTTILVTTLLSLLRKHDNFFNQYNSLSVTIIISFIAFYITYIKLPASNVDIAHYYNMLFWGGGHILQFTFLQTMMIVYGYLIQRKTPPFIMWINGIVTLALPLFILKNDDIYTIYTEHMRWFGSIGLIVFCIYHIRYITRNKIVLSSLLLFVFGGVIGLYINYDENNTIVPAHYHGTSVGITVVFMGFIYRIAPHFGLKEMSKKRIMQQIYIFASGQFLHIIGLTMLGGYGALRKTVGSNLDINQILPYFVFGVGGLLALIGGILFIFNMGCALNCRHIKKN